MVMIFLSPREMVALRRPNSSARPRQTVLCVLANANFPLTVSNVHPLTHEKLSLVLCTIDWHTFHVEEAGSIRYVELEIVTRKRFLIEAVGQLESPIFQTRTLERKRWILAIYRHSGFVRHVFCLASLRWQHLPEPSRTTIVQSLNSLHDNFLCYRFPFDFLTKCCCFQNAQLQFQINRNPAHEGDENL